MAVPRYRSAATWPLFSAGFRPFFLAAGLWACTAMILWILTLRGIVQLPTTFGPVAWHYHELLFGFVGAAVAGFLLTAVPNWTGRLPLQGWPLAGLVLLWLAGRIAVALAALVGPWPAMAVDLAFLVVFGAAIGREIIAGRNWRNLPVLIALALLVVANAMIHAGGIGDPRWQDTGQRLALSVVVMLISLIGGRIIPSFTTNWLRRRGAAALPVPFRPFDRVTLAISILALAAWVADGLGPLSGAALILAAAAHAVRLGRWRGQATLGEPLLWVLHVGYAWLPAGLALLGAAAWLPSLAATAIHALTVGAMGTMILAVMTRASLGHTRQELTANRGTLAAYLLVLLAALARLAAPLIEDQYMAALDLAATAWIAAFAIFVAFYLPLYLKAPRAR